jgi:hypothetical protein
MTLTEKDFNRILNKALASFVKGIYPDGFVVKDEATKGNYIILFDPDCERVILEETSEIHPDKDCTRATVYRLDDSSSMH